MSLRRALTVSVLVAVAAPVGADELIYRYEGNVFPDVRDRDWPDQPLWLCDEFNPCDGRAVAQ